MASSLPTLSARSPLSSPGSARAADHAATAREFIRAASTFATGVAVLTTRRADHRPIGITVASFTTVSLEPPLVLVCVHAGCRVLRHVLRCRRFAVNVLSAQQEGLSRQFASSITDRFLGVEWQPGETGAPVLADALAAFECSLVSSATGGDHRIIVGRVEQVASRRGMPLVRFGSAYRLLASFAPIP